MYTWNQRFSSPHGSAYSEGGTAADISRLFALNTKSIGWYTTQHSREEDLKPKGVVIRESGLKPGVAQRNAGVLGNVVIDYEEAQDEKPCNIDPL
jgi:hypothetical protein